MTEIYKILNKIIRRLFKLLRLNKIIFALCKKDTITFSDIEIEMARKTLESYSANPKTSCACKNKIVENVDIHIIVPAYNVEKYIAECMDSILITPPHKKYTYLVTVINDGSKDKTPEILNKYRCHENLEIIDQANRGFSGARNRGLSNIKGKYVLFVDSDDAMDWRGVEKMIDAALETNADVVRGSYTLCTENGRKTRYIKSSRGKIGTENLGGQPWAKLFKSHIFEDICFPEHYWYEDSIFAQIVYPRIKSAYGVDENTYFYRNRVSSITRQGVYKPKSIDSYWITEQLFFERFSYNLVIDQKYYEYILHMVKLTFSRIALQPYDIKRNVFILFIDFITKNFKGFNSQTKEGKTIEKILKSKDLNKCIAYAKWM